MPIETLNQTLIGLFDTGSKVSAINTEFKKFIPKSTIKPCHVKMRSAQGTFYCTQKAPLKIKCGPLIVEHTFYLMKNLPKQILFGTDFMFAHNVDVLASRQSLQIQDEIIPFISDKENKNKNITLNLEAVKFLKTNAPIDFPEQEENFFKLLDEYEDIFNEITGVAKCEPMRINTGTAKPVKQPQRRMSIKKHDMIAAHIKEMLARDWIEPSESPWRANLVCVPKPDGTSRSCGDFRGLNDVTEDDAFPSPNAQEILEFIGQAIIFSAFDLVKGYYQIPIAVEDRHKTAIFGPDGLYQFKVMPFGVKNGPKVFQRLMNTVLGPHLRKFAMVYLDDVIIYSKTAEEHLVHLKIFFEAMRKAGLTLNPKKLQPLQKRIKVLGHIIENGMVSPDPGNVEGIQKFPVPFNQTGVRKFLGTVGFYRSFIPDYVDKATPLYRLLRNDVPFEWTDSQQLAFETLKAAVINIVMALPDLKGRFTIQTDASQKGLGAVLMTDMPDSKKVPVAFISRLLQGGEKNYTTTELECLAVVWAVEKFQGYIEQTSFTIETDHMAIRWLMALDRPKGRIARWIMRLLPYDFEVVYRPGRINWVADGLSRYPVSNDPEELEALAIEPEFDEPVQITTAELADLKITREEIMKAQLADDFLIKVREYLISGTKPENISARELSLLKTAANNSFIESKPNGLLLKWQPSESCEDAEGPGQDERIILPEMFWAKIIEQFHDTPQGGHLGTEIVCDRVSKRFYWVGLYTRVKSYIAACKTCQQYNYDNKKPGGLMKPHHFLKPWEEISVDIMGPYPMTRDRNAYILTIIDIFSNWVEIFPLRKSQCDTKSIVDKLKSVFCRWGFPKIIVSDNGSQFTSHLWINCLSSLGINPKHVTPYHPQANPVERKNRDIKLFLAKFTEKHNEWDKLLNELCFALRTAVNKSTGYTPARLLMGKELSAPLDIVLATSSGPRLEPNYGKSATDLALKLHNTVQYCAENRMIASEQQKFYYDQNRREIKFDVGDLVLCKAHHLSSAINKFTAGFAPKRDGPYEIMEFHSPNNYLLGDPETKKTISIVSVDKIRKFIPPLVSQNTPVDPEKKLKTALKKAVPTATDNPNEDLDDGEYDRRKMRQAKAKAKAKIKTCLVKPKPVNGRRKDGPTANKTNSSKD